MLIIVVFGCIGFVDKVEVFDVGVDDFVIKFF